MQTAFFRLGALGIDILGFEYTELGMAVKC